MIPCDPKHWTQNTAGDRSQAPYIDNLCVQTTSYPICRTKTATDEPVNDEFSIFIRLNLRAFVIAGRAQLRGTNRTRSATGPSAGNAKSRQRRGRAAERRPKRKQEG